MDVQTQSYGPSDDGPPQGMAALAVPRHDVGPPAARPPVKPFLAPAAYVALAVLAPLPGHAQSTTKETCTAEYVANKAAITKRGLTRKDFVAECLMRPATGASSAKAAPAQTQ